MMAKLEDLHLSATNLICSAVRYLKFANLADLVFGKSSSGLGRD